MDGQEFEQGRASNSHIKHLFTFLFFLHSFRDCPAVNCGGAASKLPRLVSLILYADADVICLQESAYLLIQGPPIRGGGLLTLIHYRRLHPTARHLQPLLDEHAIVVSVPISPSAYLSIANLHLPPSLPPAERRGALVAATLMRAPPGARFIVGDLNDTMSGSSSWLRHVLARRGVWADWQPAPPLVFAPPRHACPHKIQLRFLLERKVLVPSFAPSLSCCWIKYI